MSSQFIPSARGKPKALITGGNGFVGSHLAERLAALGFDLYLLLRPTSRLNNIAGLQYQRAEGDLRDPAGLEEVLADMEYVFHSAGLVKARSADEYMTVNCGGTAKLAKLAASGCRNLKRFVYISSQAAAGPCHSETLKTESDPATPVSDYGRSKLAGEQEVLALAGEMPITIIRPSAVFGPRDTEVYQFFKIVRLGWLLKLGWKESFVSLVYIDDLVEGIIRAALSDKGVGETFFINSVDQISQWEAQTIMADTMKVELKPLRIPIPLLKVCAFILANVDSGHGNAPVMTRDKVREFSHRYWLSSSAKARSLLDYQTTCTLSQAIAETYQWYRQQRWL